MVNALCELMCFLIDLTFSPMPSGSKQQLPELQLFTDDLKMVRPFFPMDENLGFLFKKVSVLVYVLVMFYIF